MKATLPVCRLEAARVVVSTIGRCLCLTKPASHVVAEQKDKKRYKDPKEPNPEPVNDNGTLYGIN